MPDFTSALYLGMQHASSTLRPWMALTTGRPAAMQSPREAERLARNLARLLGHQRALLGTSTLHLFWDLFAVLATDPISIYADAGTYPIARWGVERIAARGVPTADFRAHDPAALEALLDRDRGSGLRPVVVTDGLCPGNGRTAPLPEYLRLVRAHNGYLVVDDTQALGILGWRPAPPLPYGSGGAGTPAWHGIAGPELIVVSSLAKGFGAPLAAIVGSDPVIAKFEELSATRVHCSPPSIAAVAAGERALLVNADRGDNRRRHLFKMVRRFRDHLRQLGLSASGSFFPVQTLQPIGNFNAAWLHDRLIGLGVKTVLHRAPHAIDPHLSFLINASHTASDIDEAADALLRTGAFARLRSAAAA